MMKTVNMLLTEIKRTVLSPYFVAGALMFTLICFTSVGFIDISTKREISIFEMMFMLGTDKAQSLDFAGERLITKGFGGWVAQLLVILVSFPFIKVMCDERLYGQKRLSVYRMGIMGYSVSKLVAAVVSAALICLFGYLGFAAIVAVVFPSASSFAVSEQDMYNILQKSFWETLMQVVCIGVSFVPLPLVLVGFMGNLYFCVCIPFLMQYLHRTLITRLFLEFASLGHYSENRFMLLQLFSHDSARLMIDGGAYALPAIGLHTAMFTGAFVLFYMMQKRRVDNGT